MSEAKDYSLGTLKIDNEAQRFTFPNVTEAKRVVRNGKETGDPKYSLNIEFLPDSAILAEAKKKAAAVARAKFGPDVNLSDLTVPWSSGDKLADKAKAKGKDREFSRGRIVLTARSKNPPQVAAIVDGKIREFGADTIQQAKRYFYTGVEGLVELYFEAYDAIDRGDDPGKPGVTCYLNAVCSLNKGERLTGRPAATETFSGYVGLNKSEDVTAGLDEGENW